MKKQPIELTEKEIGDARPVGLPKLLTTWAEELDRGLPLCVNLHKEIYTSCPDNANAFALGRPDNTTLECFYNTPIQYYLVNHRETENYKR